MSRELLFVADAVAREKGVDKEVIFQALEAALVSATKKRFGQDLHVEVSIDRKTGLYTTHKLQEVVGDEEEIDNPHAQVSLDAAKEVHGEVAVGDLLKEELPAVEFGRIAAQSAKQVIMQKVREAEREQVVADYVLRVGEMVSGVVKRMERGNAVIELGRAEALLPKDEMIPRENTRPGDRVRAILRDVRKMSRGPQLFLSRTAPEFLIKLFAMEVPEIANGLIEVKGASRDPGSRAKLAVKSNDSKIDPVGACVGLRGHRVQTVVNELKGERIDIVVWAPDPAAFVINALAPAEAQSIIVDEELHSMDVIVNEDNLSQAIGRGGQNVRLASQLTEWEINILTPEEAEEKRTEEVNTFIEAFMQDLEVDEEFAQVLVEEGFTSIEEVAYVPVTELLQIDGVDEEIVAELRHRARDALLNRALVAEEKVVMNEPDDDLIHLDGMDEALVAVLASKGVCTVEDLAELAVPELQDLTDVDEDRAKELIMKARAPWFADAQDEQ